MALAGRAGATSTNSGCRRRLPLSQDATTTGHDIGLALDGGACALLRGNLTAGRELAQGIPRRKPVMSKPEKSAPVTQQDIADKAMALKNAAPAPHHPPPERTAHEGMNDTPNTGIAPSGAFDAEGQRPVLERSRKSR